jgi:RNA polymerase sigma factor (sigma-70 family)
LNEVEMKRESKMKMAAPAIRNAALRCKELGDKIPSSEVGAQEGDVTAIGSVKGSSSSSLTALLHAYRRTGDKALATKLYQQHWHLVLGCANRILPDSADAEDAAVEVFMKVLVRLRIETPMNFAGWLYAVTKYHCFEIRRKTLQAPLLEPLDEKQQWVDQRPDYEHVEGHRAGIAFAVHHALAALPAQQRTCIELFYIEEMSYKEIAEGEGYDLRAVKSYIQNGKRRLLALLAPIKRSHALDGTL